MRRPALVAALALLCGTASADEAWRTQHGGVIVYEADHGGTAVLGAEREAGGPVCVYVSGLGGVWGADRRQSYDDAYYVAEGEGGPCEAALQAVDGRTSHDWGRARVVLTERGYPTTILLLLTPCGGADEALIVGEPITP